LQKPTPKIKKHSVRTEGKIHKTYHAKNIYHHFIRPDLGLPGVYFAISSARVPISPDMFRLCAGGFAETWPD
jgi:hypothetical protein